MNIDTNITKIIVGIKASSQNDVDEHITQHLFEETGMPKTLLIEKIKKSRANQKRAISDGVSIPNIKLMALSKPISILFTLEKPINLEAPDQRPVDIVCMLASPANDGPIHLRRLSRLTRLFKDTDLTTKIRHAETEEEIRAILTDPQGWLLAA